VKIYGTLHIVAADSAQRPRIVFEDGVQVGHVVTMVVGREIVLEAGAGIASNCFITDGEATSAQVTLDAFAAEQPGNFSPVRIGARAWIGRGSSILRGVTIGEAAVVGAGSVVVNDVPAFSTAMGNPARVVRKNS
jgi:acetyltransferase-like isoleucine patch superfamily enzyme